MIFLHRNATMTPGIRQRMSRSSVPASVRALRYGVSGETARKRKRRDSVQDLSATPHTLQTTLTPAQEAVVVELRRIPLQAGLRLCVPKPAPGHRGLDCGPTVPVQRRDFRELARSRALVGAAGHGDATMSRASRPGALPNLRR
jgi:hypothetical protein